MPAALCYCCMLHVCVSSCGVFISLSSCIASDLLLLKLLLFLRCDVPVFSTLAVRHSFPGTKQTVRIKPLHVCKVGFDCIMKIQNFPVMHFAHSIKKSMVTVPEKMSC